MTTHEGERRSPGRILLGVSVGLLAIGLLLPIVIVVLLSVGEDRIMSFPPRGFTLDWYAEAFRSDRWASRLTASAQVAVVSAVMATVLGTATAVGLNRMRYRGKWLIFGLILTPLIVPTVTSGIGMYFVWLEGWRLGPIVIGGNLTGSILGYALAHAVLAMPLAVITVTASLMTVDRNLELAAASLGASARRTFFRITLPLITPGVLGGLILSFLASWDEVIVALYMATPRFATIPVELFGQIRQSPTPTAAAISSMLMAAGVAAFLTALVVRRRGAAR